MCSHPRCVDIHCFFERSCTYRHIYTPYSASRTPGWATRARPRHTHPQTHTHFSRQQMIKFNTSRVRVVNSYNSLMITTLRTPHLWALPALPVPPLTPQPGASLKLPKPQRGAPVCGFNLAPAPRTPHSTHLPPPPNLLCVVHGAQHEHRTPCPGPRPRPCGVLVVLSSHTTLHPQTGSCPAPRMSRLRSEIRDPTEHRALDIFQ